MAENIAITTGIGESIAADEILSVKYQRVKLIHGANNTNDGDVATTNPFPVIANSKNTDGTAHSSGEITADTDSSIIATSGYSQITLYWDITAITGSWKLVLRSYDNDENKEYEIETVGAIGAIDNIRKTISICDPKIDVRLQEDSAGALTSSVRYYLMA